MIDTQAKRPIRVSTDGTAGPYIMTPVDQLGHVRALLSRHKIAHWVESDAISLDGKPAIAIINLGLSGDAARVQSILDKAHE
ncbi:MAG TPA: hypothetical protein VGH33_23620 [Isosphaeraceae bacterium]|jgi:hypothetical protein